MSNNKCQRVSILMNIITLRKESVFIVVASSDFKETAQ